MKAYSLYETYGCSAEFEELFSELFIHQIYKQNSIISLTLTPNWVNRLLISTQKFNPWPYVHICLTDLAFDKSIFVKYCCLISYFFLSDCWLVLPPIGVFGRFWQFFTKFYRCSCTIFEKIVRQKIDTNSHQPHNSSTILRNVHAKWVVDFLLLRTLHYTTLPVCGSSITTERMTTFWRFATIYHVNLCVSMFSKIGFGAPQGSCQWRLSDCHQHTLGERWSPHCDT